ncbi:MAG: DNA polymerase III subunit gamma and tau, partial [Microbacteriaceae bacterium]|nr:DNA polymerase III subunit gamma and tau [Microbacteriaceae bacterium]
MVTALYRRYRPETFAELIGQTQVTDPLRHALASDRVNHAYLFSGPRGCGKTTSARILARCLNCAEGPTDTPCGTCPSCVELSRDGGGSLDVVEIDAASHNGVDDARDLRERAVFAPARDRYKIFILDEAHMVTQQGFNALLKIVEEPPEHVKFIFATTEPDKVIGTIRSRTHHYPFRLVPPAELLTYIESLCESESVTVEDGVLPLVVRAGGGSVRDTLSVLDQLIAGSPDKTVTYDRATGLLGYTHGELLAEVMNAIAAHDGPGSFVAVDKVIHTGQDPRRFAEDLLDYVRDLIIVDAAGDSAAELLPGSGAASRDMMAGIASNIGTQRLSEIADAMSTALTSMTGATSPKLHLELLVARLLVTHSPVESGPVTHQPPPAAEAARVPAVPDKAQDAAPENPPAADLPPLSFDALVQAWPSVIDAIAEKKRIVWTAMVGTSIVALDTDVVTIGFPSLASSEVLKKSQGSGLPVNAEIVREAIVEVTGHRVRFKVQEIAPAHPEEDAAAPVEPEEGSNTVVPEEAADTVDSAVPVPSWPTVALPGSESEPEVVTEAVESVEEPDEASPATGSQSQIGEAVIREILGGELISEHPVAEG